METNIQQTERADYVTMKAYLRRRLATATLADCSELLHMYWANEKRKPINQPPNQPILEDIEKEWSEEQRSTHPSSKV